jgi:hypothetical protein
MKSEVRIEKGVIGVVSPKRPSRWRSKHGRSTWLAAKRILFPAFCGTNSIRLRLCNTALSKVKNMYESPDLQYSSSTQSADVDVFTWYNPIR